MSRVSLFCLVVFSILLYLSCGYTYGAINPDSIVGLWFFDDDDPDIAKDSSGREHDGQIKGALRVDGKYGGGLLFDGASAVVTVPDAEDLTLPIFTLVGWFNCAGPNDQWQGIVGKDTWPIAGYRLYIHRGTETLGSNFVHDADPDAHKEVVATTKVMDQQWHHGAVTYDMENFKIYTDGVMEKQRAVTNKPDENALPVRIGMQGAFNGTIDEVVIFDVALEADDIARIMEGMSKIMSPVESEGKLATLWGNLKMYGK